MSDEWLLLHSAKKLLLSDEETESDVEKPDEKERRANAKSRGCAPHQRLCAVPGCEKYSKRCVYLDDVHIHSMRPWLPARAPDILVPLASRVQVAVLGNPEILQVPHEGESRA